jgi:DNA-binding SARP family transcriptional activator
MEFRILGPVEVRIAGGCVDAGHARQRSVLAVLLLDLGRVVPTGLLIDRVWGEDPPGSVRNVLYGYVTRLRAAISGSPDPGVSLARYHGGYLLQAGPEQVDVCRFRRIVAEAAAAGQDERAAVLLHDALGLWHGPALAGLDSPWLDRMRDSLEMERMAAVLELNDVRLRLGQHSALAGELPGMAASATGEERLTGQLMLAMYRSGRKAEALHWFERTRRYMVGELGADPGSELRALHQQILTDDPALKLPEPGQLTVRREVPATPREQPAAVPNLTDRVRDAAADSEAAPDQIPLNQTGFLPASHPATRHSRARWKLTAILALAAALGVSLAIVGLKTDHAPAPVPTIAPTVPISEQIGALSQQLGNADPVNRVMIIQRLMAIANSHPGTKSVSNLVLTDLISFAVYRSRQPRPAGQPPPDLLYALQAIGGGEGDAFVDTPNLTKYLNGANLAGLSLAGLQFNTAILTGADLQGTDLRGVGLSLVMLSHAQLQRADLTDADLTGADLSAAQLQDADLRGAKLAGADFSGANLTGATLPCQALPQAKNVPLAAVAHCAR